jgi:hypothetical protein
MEKFKYTVGDIDEVVDERGNSVALLRKLAWGDNAEKLELRKWIYNSFHDWDSLGRVSGLFYGKMGWQNAPG